jgi:hypothetical protein
MEMAPCRGPVCYRCHTWVSSTGRGAPSHPSWCCGWCGPQAWPITAIGRVEACPLPSLCQGFDPRTRAFMFVVVGGYAAPPAACAFTRGLTRTLGVRRDGPPDLGVRWGRVRALRVGWAGAHAQGVRRGENCALGVRWTRGHAPWSSGRIDRWWPSVPLLWVP